MNHFVFVKMHVKHNHALTELQRLGSGHGYVKKV